MTSAGERLLKSARQARRIARGEIEPAKIHIPVEIEVKAIRTRLQLTQDDFASEFGFTINQIKDWEQNRSRPLGAARAYLMLIDRHPKQVREMLKEVTAEMKNSNGDDGNDAFASACAN